MYRHALGNQALREVRSERPTTASYVTSSKLVCATRDPVSEEVGRETQRLYLLHTLEGTDTKTVFYLHLLCPTVSHKPLKMPVFYHSWLLQAHVINHCLLHCTESHRWYMTPLSYRWRRGENSSSLHEATISNLTQKWDVGQMHKQTLRYAFWYPVYARTMTANNGTNLQVHVLVPSASQDNDSQ